MDTTSSGRTTPMVVPPNLASTSSKSSLTLSRSSSTTSKSSSTSSRTSSSSSRSTSTSSRSTSTSSNFKPIPLLSPSRQARRPPIVLEGSPLSDSALSTHCILHSPKLARRGGHARSVPLGTGRRSRMSHSSSMSQFMMQYE